MKKGANIMTEKVLTTRQGALWVQPAGPNTPVHFLGCHDLGDISEKVGSVELLRCMNKKGGWRTVGSTQSPPDAITTSIENMTFGVRDWLEKLSCEFTLYALQRECGEPDIFTNYVRALILNNARVTGITDKSIVHHETDTGSSQSRDIEAWPPLIRTGTLTLRRQTTSETKDLNDIYTYVPINCDVNCPTPGETAVAATDTSTYDEDVLQTVDGGATWSILAADPFTAGENVLSIVAFPISNTVTRILAAQAAVANAFGRVSYSDDNGATWTEVVFPILGHGAMDSGALFALDQSHVWLASAKGYVYFSDDGGASWTAQTAGTLTIKDAACVSFADENNGMVGCADDILLKTSDGGTTWELTAAVTGSTDSITCVSPSGDFWWAGTDGGDLYYTKDSGDTWTQRVFSGTGVGEIADIAFANELIGYAIHNTAAPVGEILVTINGGYTWKAVTTPANAGLNALTLADSNTVYAVGNASGGTAVIVKAGWD
jgi:photosystem II stability/assembly factor-like uncharacterized protein